MKYSATMAENLAKIRWPFSLKGCVSRQKAEWAIQCLVWTEFPRIKEKPLTSIVAPFYRQTGKWLAPRAN